MDFLYFKLFHDTDFHFGDLQDNIIKNKDVSFQSSYLAMLPENILFRIFYFLDAKDLCRISTVNRRLNWLSNDEVFWRKKLYQDAHCWKKINSINNPLNFLSNETNLKNCYLKCLPQNRPNTVTYKDMIMNSIPTFIKNSMPQNRRNFCLIGPGLDIGKLEIVKKIMIGGRKDLYSFVSLSQGNSTGFGGGLIIKTIQNNTHCLIPLFTTTKDKRDHSTIEKRLLNNCLYEGDTLSGRLQINNSANNFLSTVNGVIYVIEDNFDSSHYNYFHEELHLLSSCISSKTPILILIMMSSSFMSWRNSCLNFIKGVDMSGLTQPWQVNKCSINGMDEFISSLDWINGNSGC